MGDLCQAYAVDEKSETLSTILFLVFASKICLTSPSL